MKRRELLASAALAGGLPAWTLAAGPMTLPEMDLHDPFIVTDKASMTYWLFTKNTPSVSGKQAIGVMAYRSSDLKHWTRPELVFQLPAGIWANDGCWAPEVHRWRGRWYLFVTVHNEGLPLAEPGPVFGQRTYRRSTVLAVADQLGGPFTLVRDGEPVVSKDLMTLDGTLYVDPAGKPWMVFAHEWLQLRVGAFAAVPLDEELHAIGPPRELFRGDASPVARPQQGLGIIVTDGPQLYRTADGSLHMLWSSWGEDGYFQTLARSESGNLFGPWKQLPVWLSKGSGHGMLFRTLDDGWMLVVHRPFKNARGKLYEVRERTDGFELGRQRVDLDLDPRPLQPRSDA
ncbi:glycoside hydrolase family 43 protein [Roseateles sp.]|uniref:glycoside hydrolase family 43 protein n=1 Tax=Roseateles sp. TaxID=1971397 RepID=UPI0025CEC2CE|nr:glycoside hydrolase family 43 protein [Roseateles sp.]MBV8034520.1 family 43 glycosylhydrolase [Roseateles sp.]